MIDEVRLWKTALSQSFLLNHMLIGLVGVSSYHELVSYWTMETAYPTTHNSPYMIRDSLNRNDLYLCYWNGTHTVCGA